MLGLQDHLLTMCSTTTAKDVVLNAHIELCMAAWDMS